MALPSWLYSVRCTLTGGRGLAVVVVVVTRWSWSQVCRHKDRLQHQHRSPSCHGASAQLPSQGAFIRTPVIPAPAPAQQIALCRVTEGEREEYKPISHQLDVSVVAREPPGDQRVKAPASCAAMSGEDCQQLILSPLSLDNSYSPLTDPHHVDRGRHPQYHNRDINEQRQNNH